MNKLEEFLESVKNISEEDVVYGSKGDFSSAEDLWSQMYGSYKYTYDPKTLTLDTLVEAIKEFQKGV